ncbi:MAG: M23 family metallopeptidase [bacterium]|nr:M23 family metallopeptidase [bacterium]
MEQPIKEDSSDNLYSYNITSSFLDLASYSEEGYAVKERKGLLFQTRLVLQVLLGWLGSLVLVSWDSLRFLFAYAFFIQKKAVALVHFLDLSKDQAVHFMMWRRGVLFRPATHGGFLALGALAILVGGIFSKVEIAAQDLTASENLVSAPNTPETIIPLGRPRSEIVKYQVKNGDTISSVAKKFSVSADSIKWATSLKADKIKPGETLKVPPVTGVVYKVAAGDTLASVAAKYSADKQTIADYPFNYIDATLQLKLGQTLVVPNGSIPEPKPALATPARSYLPNLVAHGSGALAWPVRGCQISQYASWFHPAIDIACPYGTAVYAADSGRVIVAKKLAYDFGWHVVIDHGNGMTSLYAHMSALYPRVGDNIGRGQLVGAVGTSGRATGPHLHFQVTRASSSLNPMSLLP